MKNTSRLMSSNTKCLRRIIELSEQTSYTVTANDTITDCYKTSEISGGGTERATI